MVDLDIDIIIKMKNCIIHTGRSVVAPGTNILLPSRPAETISVYMLKAPEKSSF